MKCPKCGAENELRAEYCLKCGSRFRIGPDGQPLSNRGLQAAIAGSAALAVVFIAGLAFFLSSGGGGDDGPTPLPEPSQALITANRSARDTTVSLLGSGTKGNKPDTRFYDIIAAGLTWSELKDAIFPTSEVEIVLIYPDAEATSVGLITNKADPERVESLWRELGQPDRKRPIYVAPVGDLSNLEVERWLRERLTSIGFQITTDQSKAKERLLFTVTR